MIHSLLDRNIVRAHNRSDVRFPLFVQFAYTDHRMVKFTIDIDMSHIQGTGYWNLNKSIRIYTTYQGRVNVLARRALSGSLSNNHWCLALKQAICLESI